MTTETSVHIRVVDGETETVGQRQVRGELIDIVAPTWIGIVRDVVADLKAADPGDDLGRQEEGDWWAGGSVEEYRDFRVIHRTDPSVSLASKTDAGARALRAAADKRGIYLP
jgi:hypothetical protein